MKYLFTLLASCFISSFTFSNHIIGGEFYAESLGNNEFLVTLTLYRDCNSGGATLDPSINITVFEGITNSHLPDLGFNMSLGDSEILELGDECFVPDLCVESGTYELIITLPDNPNGYYLTWERCCRTNNLDNINSVDAGMVFTVTIADPSIENSTPQFGPYPTDAYFCVNGSNQINFGATDIDGDELVYSLVTPLIGEASSSFNPSPALAGPKPYLQASWVAPYSESDMVGGTPPMSINSETGVITASPDVQGVFSFAVLVEEYRNGVKIGEIIRDMLFFAIICDTDQPSEITFEGDMDEFTVFPGETLCFDIFVSDPNEGDTLFLEASSELLDGTIIPQAIFAPDSSLSDISTDFCWSPVCENLRDEPYVVTFTAFSRGCSDSIMVTEREVLIYVELEEDYQVEFLTPDTITIDLYNPDTHCWNFIVDDPNNEDTVYVSFSSPIFDLPNAETIPEQVGVGGINFPYCWDVLCENVQDEPYPVDIVSVSRNCETNDTVYYRVEVYVMVQENLPTTFISPVDSVYWEFYSEEEFCFPVQVVDNNYFDTLMVTAQSEIFGLTDSTVFSPLSGNSDVEGEFCWVPTCEDVREEPYWVYFTATANSCKTSDIVLDSIAIYLRLPEDYATAFTFPDFTVLGHDVGVDEPINFPVMVTDANEVDTLRLTATSRALSNNHAAVFPGDTGTLSVQSNFSWIPTCQDVDLELYEVVFQVQTESCQKNLTAEYVVNLKIGSPTSGFIDPVMNVFTPNGDNKNDAFIIEHKDDVCITPFTARIFDRWGRQVFETNDPAFEWKGEGNGGSIPESAYFYTIEYFYKDATHTYSGNLNVLR